jgi:hypothetical protein
MLNCWESSVRESVEAGSRDEHFGKSGSGVGVGGGTEDDWLVGMCSKSICQLLLSA